MEFSWVAHNIMNAMATLKRFRDGGEYAYNDGITKNKMLKDKNGHAKVIEEAELYVRAKLKLEILKPWKEYTAKAQVWVCTQVDWKQSMTNFSNNSIHWKVKGIINLRSSEGRSGTVSRWRDSVDIYLKEPASRKFTRVLLVLAREVGWRWRTARTVKAWGGGRKVEWFGEIPSTIGPTCCDAHILARSVS